MVTYSALDHCGVAATILQLLPVCWISFEQDTFPGAANLKQERVGATYAIIRPELDERGLNMRSLWLLVLICSTTMRAAVTAAKQ